MAEPRKLKKSESLEIRIPYPTKQAFMARCQADGRSASEALRGFIDGQLAAPEPARVSPKTWRLIAGAAIAVAMGAIAVPSLAHTDARAEFTRLDANGDGVISASDLARLDANHDGTVSLSEYRRS